MKKILTMVVGSFLVAISVLAETRTWIGTEELAYDWTVGSNWQDGIKPEAGDTASFSVPPTVEKVSVVIPNNNPMTVDAIEGLPAYDILFHIGDLLTVRDPSQFFGAFRVDYGDSGYNGGDSGQMGGLFLRASETHVPVVNTYDARFISEVRVPWGTTAEIKHVVNTEPGFFQLQKESDIMPFAGSLMATFDQGIGQFFCVNAGSLIVRETERAVDLGGAILRPGATLGVTVSETAKVGAVVGEGGTIVKSGDGKLKLGTALGMETERGAPEDCYPLPTADISVAGGSVGTMAPIAIDEQVISTDPFLHLDASADGAIVESEGTITEWKDVTSSKLRSVTGLCYPEDGRRPVLVRDESGGKPYVDCGTFTDRGGNPGDGTAGYFQLATENDPCTVRAGFFVIRQKVDNMQAHFLGDIYDAAGFLRGQYCRLIHAFAWGGGASPKACYGEWRVDGVSVDVRRYRLAAGEFHLISFITAEPVYQTRVQIGGSKGANYGTGMFGGLDIAEVVLFDQTLVDGEREALEKRLMEKWLGRTHPLSSTSVAVGTVSFASGVTPTIDTDKDMAVSELVGSGTLVKEGDAGLTVSSVSGIDGVDVRGGVLDLSISSDISVLNEAYLHFDPSDESTLTQTEDGRVVKIEDLRGNGRSAVPSHWTRDHSSVAGPALIDGPTSGLKLLDCGLCNQSDSCCGMRWSEDHTTVQAAVIVVNKVGEGGVPGLLGDDFDTAFATEPGSAILGYRDSNLRRATWLLDGEPIDPAQTEWPQGLHVIAFNIPAKDASGNPLYGVAANLFAQDRDDHLAVRIGGLDYGEMAVFNRALTPAELTALSNHFTEKWLGQLPPPGLVVDNLSVAAGSMFKLSGGLGIQDNSSVSFGYAKSAPTPVEVTGGVQLGENVAVTIPDGKGRLPILKADAFTGAEALKTWTLNGERRRFEIADGVLYAKCSSAGLMIMIR